MRNICLKSTSISSWRNLFKRTSKYSTHRRNILWIYTLSGDVTRKTLNTIQTHIVTCIIVLRNSEIFILLLVFFSCYPTAADWLNTIAKWESWFARVDKMSTPESTSQWLIHVDSLYICVCIYVYTYTHIYIYVYKKKFSRKRFLRSGGVKVTSGKYEKGLFFTYILFISVSICCGGVGDDGSDWVKK